MHLGCSADKETTISLWLRVSVIFSVSQIPNHEVSSIE